MKISILIPCYNEEKSIGKCVESCLNQTKRAHEIVVVNDGSTDNTSRILDRFGNKIKVVRIARNSGKKSCAQETGLEHITGDVVVCTDADTVLAKNFIHTIERNFRDKHTAAVCSYVKSLKYNWLTACRDIEYTISQTIHKLAQSYLGFLFVIPGCAAAFRTDVFKKHISFEHDTVTEDLDFTYKLNKKGLKIRYDQKALVYTQDPGDLKSYIRQMTRWYKGGWQNLLKHYEILKKPAAAIELTLIYSEGFMTSILFLLLPFINIKYFLSFLSFYFPLVLLLAIHAAIKNKRPELILYSPLYLAVISINSFIFLKEFIKVFLLRERNLVWQKPKRREISNYDTVPRANINNTFRNYSY